MSKSKNRLYSIIACFLSWGLAVLIFCVAAFGSPDGCFDAALQLIETDTGKTLGMLVGSLILFFVGFYSLLDAIFYRKKAHQKVDQTDGAAHEPHPCLICSHRPCTCCYCDCDELGCQGDYHCPEKYKK